MKNRLLFLIGGSDRQNGDYSHLLDAAGTKAEFQWSTPKDAHAGDLVLLYIRQPKSEIIAKGKVLAPAYKTNGRDSIRYRAPVGNIELISNRVHIRELKKAFPNWRWLTQPRKHAVVPPEYSSKLWKLVHQAKEKTPTLEQIAAKVGAGFGSPEQNRKVEQLQSRRQPVSCEARDTQWYRESATRLVMTLKQQKGAVSCM